MFGLFAAHSRAAEKPAPELYLLQYKFHAGEEVRSKVKHLASIETTVAGTTQKTQMASLSTKLWRVTAVNPNGEMTFENLVENVDMRNRMSGREEVRYNSLMDKAAPPGYEDVAKSVGQVLSVVTIDGSGAVIKRVEKHGRPGVAANSGQILPPLPKDKIEVGHVWDAPTVVKVQLKDGTFKDIKTRQRYELKKVESNVAIIDVETQILTPVTNPEIQVQLVQRLTKGEIRFDISAGRILSQHLELDEQVLGFSGAESSMHYIARFTDDLVPPETKTAAADKASAKEYLALPETKTAAVHGKSREGE
jgi:hypothetical protein